ncbi:PREDICTED: sodium-dependent nutrient amino acid transporter 1-like isoform X2 [Ceratosolen solmsi marchali]|uniref:Sodium-dependent nutrient amino acid transporter 1 n=1 Tax=Ceratosolen solmsi marchali TaxID=326594 RepID=A0AAJ6YJE8_9HYME|nr:PREDICTED: sodium-dependent nutrient amino acid transporter 1-like isoform X2 [Ceratosolen solmsi marchali]
MGHGASFQSLQSELPWSKCRPEWGTNCIDSSFTKNSSNLDDWIRKSSAELFFYKEVIHEKANILDGLGTPDWHLSIYLALSWLCVLLVVVQGVKSSGKAAYFLALFPYVIMIALLIRAVTLEGATTGILYFIRPNWSKLFQADVWYAAVTQCFFSLTVCFGPIIMFSSHNKFNHDVYRDAQIVTSLDTLTSLMAGFTIFGILGNLAHELGTDDISNVVRSGSGLAFISYPDAIAKFSQLPQFFSIIFFVMMFVLGVGSEAALTSSIITVLHDQFPHCRLWPLACIVVALEFLIGLIYVTPGGQFMITFVDFYATSFVAFVPAIFELMAIFYIYGHKNFLADVEFMLKRKLSMFWLICWKFVTPILIGIIFSYSIINHKLLTYNNVYYPHFVYIIGWILFSFALLQIPLWMTIAFFKNRSYTYPDIFKRAFEPCNSWGPKNQEIRKKWIEFRNATI